MPRRNVNQPRRAVKTVAEQLGLPAKALNTAVHDGSDGVESLFDAEALAAFEHKLKNGIVEPDHPHPAMQETEIKNGHCGLSVAAKNNGLLFDDLYPTAPPPTNPKILTDLKNYQPTWQTTHRNSNK